MVPNPDVLYPDGLDRFSIGPGGIAELIESAVSRRFGDDDAVKFTKLGKPYSPMFDAIKQRLNVTPESPSWVISYILTSRVPIKRVSIPC